MSVLQQNNTKLFRKLFVNGDHFESKYGLVGSYQGTLAAFQLN